MKRIGTFITIFLFLSMSAHGAERVLSLSDAMTLAVQNNLSLKLAHADTEEARARVAQTAAGLLPLLFGTVSQARTFKTNLAAQGFPATGSFPFDILIGPFNTFDARVQATQRLLDVEIYRQTRAVRALADVSEWQVKLAGDQVATAAALAYIEAQRSSRVIEAAQSDVDLANTLLKQTHDQHRAGTAAGIDEARAQTRLAQEQVRLIRAHTDGRQARIRLARVAGLPLQDTLQLSDPLTMVSPDTSTLTIDIPFAWHHRFELRVVEAETRAAEESLRAAQAGYYPSIRAAGDYGYSGNLPEGSARTGSIRGILDLPIFSGGSRTAAIRDARAKKSATQARLSDMQEQIEEDVRLSIETLSAAVEELRATDQEVKLAEQELQMARDRFSAGVGDNIQLLSAQTALEVAREGQVNALASYQIARVNWAMATGTMSTFHL